MSKRAGDFVTLRDLVDEVGVDAARYFFLMRQGDSPAHLRRRPRQAADRREPGLLRADGARPAERHLPHRRASSPDAVAGDARPRGAAGAGGHRAAQEAGRVSRGRGRAAAREREPHRITGYLEELARLAHGWYHHCRVLGEPPPIEQARLVLARAARIVLANGLALSASPPPTGCDAMSLLVVGSVALDSIFTPFGETADALGGSAVFFSVAGCAPAPGAGGRAWSAATTRSQELERLAPRGIDWCGRGAGRGRELPLEGEVLLRPAEPGDAGDAPRRLRRTSSRKLPADVPATPSSSSSATSIPSCSSACSTRCRRRSWWRATR